MEFDSVVIAYNTGSYKPAKGLKPGFFDGEKYYGEWIDTYLKLSRTVEAAAHVAAGRYVVIARGGLKLRGGPGTNFESEDTFRRHRTQCGIGQRPFWMATFSPVSWRPRGKTFGSRTEPTVPSLALAVPRAVSLRALPALRRARAARSILRDRSDNAS
jgi:hypothetical protein